MKKTIYLYVLLTSLLAYEASAQFTISGEVRPRAEFRNGFKTLTTDVKDPAFFIEQRSRIYFDYVNENFKFKLAFQDVRIWGETSQVFKTEPGVTFLSEAWGQYYFNTNLSVRAGRQIISYDNERILGGLEWAQQGRRHDAVVFMYEDEVSKTKIHLGGAYNQDKDVPEPALLQGNGAGYYSVGGNYKTMQYGWFNKTFEAASVSLVALNAGYQNADTTVSFKQTFGATGFTTLSGIKLGGDFYYQTGKLGENKVNAYMVGLNVTFKTPVTPLTFGAEYVSGKDQDDTGSDITSFSPDFGTNHAHNGFMDYFYVGSSNGTVGVTDIYLKSSFKLIGGSLNAHLHHFLTGSTQFVTGETTELEKSMGTEVDLVFVKKLKGGVIWHLGYSQMFATDTMEALRGGDKSAVQNWAWTMITFKPTFFQSEK